VPIAEPRDAPIDEPGHDRAITRRLDQDIVALDVGMDDLVRMRFLEH
jgi:hypothetical protein